MVSGSGAAAVAASGSPVSQLLQRLGLGHFADVFAAEQVDSLEMLAALDAADFRDMGVPKGPMALMRRHARQLTQPPAADGGDED